MDTSNQKPDLLAPVRGAAQTGTRILATLEYGNRLPGKISHVPRWHLDGWTAGMGGAVLVMAALAWMSREAAIAGGPGRPLASSQAAPAVLTPPSRSGAISTATPTSFTAAPQEASAATIVSLPEAAQPPAARAAATSAPSAVAASATTNMNATTSRATSHATAPPLAAAVAKPLPSIASRGAAASTSARETAGTRATASTANAAAPPDTDVALLTALVAHAGTTANVTPERSRDVVLRQEGESTTLLLARCKQLGLIEGMLCRSRICSGRWESDPACRAPSH